MAVDPTEALLGRQPRIGHPALHHIGIAPTGHVVRAALASALGFRTTELALYHTLGKLPVQALRHES